MNNTHFFINTINKNKKERRALIAAAVRYSARKGYKFTVSMDTVHNGYWPLMYLNTTRMTVSMCTDEYLCPKDVELTKEDLCG